MDKRKNLFAKPQKRSEFAAAFDHVDHGANFSVTPPSLKGLRSLHYEEKQNKIERVCAAGMQVPQEKKALKKNRCLIDFSPALLHSLKESGVLEKGVECFTPSCHDCESFCRFADGSTCSEDFPESLRPKELALDSFACAQGWVFSRSRWIHSTGDEIVFDDLGFSNKQCLLCENKALKGRNYCYCHRFYRTCSNGSCQALALPHSKKCIAHLSFDFQGSNEEEQKEDTFMSRSADYVTGGGISKLHALAEKGANVLENVEQMVINGSNSLNRINKVVDKVESTHEHVNEMLGGKNKDEAQDGFFKRICGLLSKYLSLEVFKDLVVSIVKKYWKRSIFSIIIIATIGYILSVVIKASWSTIMMICGKIANFFDTYFGSHMSGTVNEIVKEHFSTPRCASAEMVFDSGVSGIHKSLCKLTSFVALLSLGGRVSSKSVALAMMGAGKASQSIETVIDLADYLTDYLPTNVGIMLRSSLGFSRRFGFLKSDLERLSHMSKLIYQYDADPARFSGSRMQVDSFCEAYDKFHELYPSYMSKVLSNTPEAHILNNIYRDSKAIFRAIAPTRETNPIKQVPVGIYLCGPPGIGKTYLVTNLAARLFPETNKDERIYVANISDKYCEGYNGQKIWHCDEFGNFSSQDSKDAVGEVLNIISSANQALCMAFEKKGKAFFKSEVYLATTNTKLNAVESNLKNVQALERRFHEFQVIISEEYRLGNDKVDFNKLQQQPMNIKCNMPHLLFKCDKTKQTYDYVQFVNIVRTKIGEERRKYQGSITELDFVATASEDVNIQGGKKWQVRDADQRLVYEVVRTMRKAHEFSECSSHFTRLEQHPGNIEDMEDALLYARKVPKMIGQIGDNWPFVNSDVVCYCVGSIVFQFQSKWYKIKLKKGSTPSMILSIMVDKFDAEAKFWFNFFGMDIDFGAAAPVDYRDIVTLEEHKNKASPLECPSFSKEEDNDSFTSSSTDDEEQNGSFDYEPTMDTLSEFPGTELVTPENDLSNRFVHKVMKEKLSGRPFHCFGEGFYSEEDHSYHIDMTLEAAIKHVKDLKSVYLNKLGNFVYVKYSIPKDNEEKEPNTRHWLLYAHSKNIAALVKLNEYYPELDEQQKNKFARELYIVPNNFSNVNGFIDLLNQQRPKPKKIDLRSVWFFRSLRDNPRLLALYKGLKELSTESKFFMGISAVLVTAAAVAKMSQHFRGKEPEEESNLDVRYRGRKSAKRIVKSSRRGGNVEYEEYEQPRFDSRRLVKKNSILSDVEGDKNKHMWDVFYKNCDIMSCTDSRYENATMDCTWNGSFVLINLHMFTYLDEKGMPKIVKDGTRFELKGGALQFNFDFNKLKTIKNRDGLIFEICAYDLTGQSPPSARITQHFVPENKLPVGDVEGFWYGNNSEVIHIDEVDFEVTSTRLSFCSVGGSAKGKKENAWVPSCVLGPPRTGGDCGGRYVLQDNDRVFIFGLHFATFGNVRGAGAIITREDIVSLCGADAGIQLDSDVLPVDRNCEIPYISKHLEPIGRHDEATSKGNMKTKLRPTLFQEEGDDSYSPADLGKEQSIFSLARNEFARVDVVDDLDKNLLDMACQHVSKFSRSIESGTNARVLTMDEALNGGVHFPRLSPLPMSTSAGFEASLTPEYKACKRTPKGKHPFVELVSKDNTLKYEITSPWMKSRIAELEHDLKRGKIPNVLCRYCPKDELRPKKKIEAGLTRFISVPPFAFTVVVRKYMGAFFDHLSADFKHIMVGMNVYSSEWHHMIEDLRNTSTVGFDVDQKKFEGSHTHQSYHFYQRIMEDFYGDKGSMNAKIRSRLLAGGLFKLLMIGPYVYRMYFMLASGLPWTTLFNCLWLMVLTRYSYLHSRKVKGLSITLANYDDEVLDKVFGDDMIIASNVDFTGQHIYDALSPTGRLVTCADKEGELGDKKPIEELQFLQCTTTVADLDGDGVFWRAYSLQESLEKQLLAGNVSFSLIDRSILKANGVLMRLEQSGPERYERWRERLERKLEEKGYYTTFRDWKSMHFDMCHLSDLAKEEWVERELNSMRPPVKKAKTRRGLLEFIDVEPERNLLSQELKQEQRFVPNVSDMVLQSGVEDSTITSQIIPVDQTTPVDVTEPTINTAVKAESSPWGSLRDQCKRYCLFKNLPAGRSTIHVGEALTGLSGLLARYAQSYRFYSGDLNWIFASESGSIRVTAIYSSVKTLDGIEDNDLFFNNSEANQYTGEKRLQIKTQPVTPFETFMVPPSDWSHTLSTVDMVYGACYLVINCTEPCKVFVAGGDDFRLSYIWRIPKLLVAREKYFDHSTTTQVLPSLVEFVNTGVVVNDMTLTDFAAMKVTAQTPNVNVFVDPTDWSDLMWLEYAHITIDHTALKDFSGPPIAVRAFNLNTTVIQWVPPVLAPSSIGVNGAKTYSLIAEALSPIESWTRPDGTSGSKSATWGVYWSRNRANYNDYYRLYQDENVPDFDLINADNIAPAAVGVQTTLYVAQTAAEWNKTTADAFDNPVLDVGEMKLQSYVPDKRIVSINGVLYYIEKGQKHEMHMQSDMQSETKEELGVVTEDIQTHDTSEGFVKQTEVHNETFNEAPISIKDLAVRETIVGTVKITPGMVSGFQVASFDIPKDLLTSTQNSAGFNRYVMSRPGCTIYFRLASTMFQQGVIAWQFEPLVAKAGLPDNNLHSLYQRPHVRLQLGGNSTASLRVPFRHILQAIEHGATENLGRLTGVIFNQMKVGSTAVGGATQATILISVKFDEVEFGMLDPRVTPITPANMVLQGGITSKVTTVNIDHVTDSNVGYAGGSDNFEQEGELGLAGMDRPMVSISAVPTQAKDPELSSCQNIDYGYAMTLYPNLKETMPKPGTFGTPEDEMKVEHVCNRMSYHETVTLHSGFTTGKILTSGLMTVSPRVASSGLNAEYYPSMMEWIANNMTLWSATLKYRVEGISAKPHAWKLAFIPVYGVHESLSFSELMSQSYTVMAFDSDNQVFEVKTPPKMKTKKLRIPHGVLPESVLNGYSMGRWYLVVLNELVTMDSVASEVDINIYIGAENVNMSLIGPGMRDLTYA